MLRLQYTLLRTEILQPCLSLACNYRKSHSSCRAGNYAIVLLQAAAFEAARHERNARDDVYVYPG